MKSKGSLKAKPRDNIVSPPKPLPKATTDAPPPYMGRSSFPGPGASDNKQNRNYKKGR